MRKILPIFVALLCIFASTMAQNRTVTGIVTEKATGNTLPGVSIVVQGTKTGTQTGIDGKFSISAPAGATLVFSSLGYIRQSVQVAGTTLNVALETDTKTLTEVVVTGYGTQAKSDNIGSIAKVSAKDIENKPIQSFDQALGGKAAGVQITIPNGVINNPPVIRVRGINSISLSSYPLIIIDGVASYTGDQSGSSAAGNALSAINPNDIESVDILKDAAAAAIYGSRAANGVIVVTTKKGTKGKASVTFDSWVSTTKVQNLPHLLSAYQYTDLKNEAAKNQGTYNDISTDLIPDLYFRLMNDANGNVINTNWYDYVYRTGVAYSNSLAVSGGNESTSYYLSGNFTSQQGIIMNNNYRRKSGIFKVDHKEGKIFEVGGKMQFSNEDNLSATSSGSLSGEAFGTGGLGRLAIVTAPSVPAKNADGSYAIFNATTIGRGANVGSDVGFYNPAAVLELDRSNNELNTIQSNFYLQANVMPWLKAKTQYNIIYLLSDNDSFGNPINGGSATGIGSASESYSKNKRWTWTNTLQGSKTFGSHSIMLLAGNEQQRSRTRGFGAGRSGLSDPAFNDFSSGYTSAPSNSSSFGENYLVSFFGQATYDFKKKYFLSANVRQDEYSAFGASNKKGVFYGVGLGWEITKEGFWESAGLSNVFSSFKPRASYGTVGNIAGLGNLASYSFYGSGLYNGAASLVPTQAGNAFIGWESSKKLDIGLNFGILDERVTFETAYYKNDLEDLIYSVPQAPSAGLPSSPQINVASMYNKGFEFTVNADVYKTPKFSWNTSFNISKNANKITSLATGITQFVTTTSSLESASISQVGGPLGMIYVVPTLGVDPATGRRAFLQKSTGKKVYYQHNLTNKWTYEDGTVSSAISLANDGIAYKSTQPKVYGGFDNNFTYKKFDLNMTITYSLGNYVYYGTNAGLRDQRFWNNSTDLLRRWKNPGDNTDIPKSYFGDNVSNGSSFPIDVNVFKGDFAKIRSLTLGYSLPASLLSKMKVASARAYISGNNLLILTKYPGSDPEVSSNGNSTSSAGVDRNSVGNGLTFTAGISVKF